MVIVEENGAKRKSASSKYNPHQKTKINETMIMEQGSSKNKSLLNIIYLMETFNGALGTLVKITFPNPKRNT